MRFLRVWREDIAINAISTVPQKKPATKPIATQYIQSIPATQYIQSIPGLLSALIDEGPLGFPANHGPSVSLPQKFVQHK